jgi:SAM-dependent methyltransferase
VVTLAFREALARQGHTPWVTQAFDLTPAMIERFKTVLAERQIEDVEVVQADVLELDALPQGWDGYDLVLTASMMEYLPRNRIAEALNGLRLRLREGGRLVLFITRPTWYTLPVVGWLWRSNLYTAADLRRAFEAAGFSSFSFPGPARLTRSQHIVEAVR